MMEPGRAYFFCGQEKHRHRRQDLADDCISRTLSKIKVARMVINGSTLIQAARTIDVTHERCRVLVTDVIRLATDRNRRLPGGMRLDRMEDLRAQRDVLLPLLAELEERIGNRCES